MAKALQRCPERDTNIAHSCQNQSHSADQVRGNGKGSVLEVASRCSATDCSGNGSGLHRYDRGDGHRKSRRSPLSLDVAVIAQSAADTEVRRAFDLHRGCPRCLRQVRWMRRAAFPIATSAGFELSCNMRRCASLSNVGWFASEDSEGARVLTVLDQLSVNFLLCIRPLRWSRCWRCPLKLTLHTLQ